MHGRGRSPPRSAAIGSNRTRFRPCNFPHEKAANSITVYNGKARSHSQRVQAFFLYNCSPHGRNTCTRKPNVCTENSSLFFQSVFLVSSFYLCCVKDAPDKGSMSEKNRKEGNFASFVPLKITTCKTFSGYIALIYFQVPLAK